MLMRVLLVVVVLLRQWQVVRSRLLLFSLRIERRVGGIVMGVE